MKRFTSRYISLSMILALTVLGAVAAQAGDTILRFQGQNTDSGVEFEDGGELSAEVGGYLGVERKLNERFGIEIGASWTDFEQDLFADSSFFTIDVSSSVRMIPVTLALDVHLLPGSRHDLYVAPKVGYAFFDDMNVNTAFSVNLGLPTGLFDGFDIPIFVDTEEQIAVKDQFI